MTVSLPLGFATGFLKAHLMSGPWWKLLGFGLWLAVKPCLFEESFFRVLLLPHRTVPLSGTKVIAVSAFGLGVFVLAHPLNGLWLRRSAFQVFVSPVFLSLATLLGLACTLLYRKTGSVWPPILLHWVTVVAWILFLGGRNLLLGITP